MSANVAPGEEAGLDTSLWKLCNASFRNLECVLVSFLFLCRCDGRKACEMNINMVHTSDPCSGTLKYLDTIYSCSPAGLSL